MTDLPPPPPAYGTAQFVAPETSVELSGWWRRALAIVLDTVLLAALGFAAGFAIGATGAGNGVLAILILGLFAGQALYEVAMTAKNNGQTLGKMALGIRVVYKHQLGSELRWGTCWRRWAVRFGATMLMNIMTGMSAVLGLVGVVILAVGYLAPLWGDDNQTWYDKSADTVVVRA